MDAIPTSGTLTAAPQALPQPIRGPVPERNLTVLDIADGAFAIVRTRPKTVAAILAAFILPFQLVSTWLQRDTLATFDLNNYDETGQFDGDVSMASIVGGSLVASFLIYLMLPFIGVALTHLVHGWKLGLDRSALECLKFTLRKTPTILAAFVLCKLIQFFTVGLATPVLMIVAPIIAAEGSGPVEAIRRSWRLAKPRLGPLFGLLIIIAVVNQLLGTAVGVLPVAAAFVFGNWGWIAFFGLNVVSTAALTVLGVGASVLVYGDLRNRVEGRDLLVRLQDATLRRDTV